jgi:hypothetical protein
MLPIKTPGQMPLHIQKEITHYNEMNDKIFSIDIDMNICAIARNGIEPIFFHLFHGEVIQRWLFDEALFR